jgi:DNA topoisomerase-1
MTGKLRPLLYDAQAAAHAARLIHRGDSVPGYTRRRRGKRFVYVDTRGRPVKSPRVLARIRSLVIPPAWTNVWISPSPNGHIQATGRDARGRKQYKYHPQFRKLREAAKYQHIVRFGQKLPELRRRLKRDLARPGLDREKVVSAIVEVMQRTCMRVGNDCYAIANGSYGITTLRDRHAKIAGSELAFEFKGKSGKIHRVTLHDPKLSRVVKRCRDAPGQRLFQYQDADGSFRPVTSTHVNDYLRTVTGEPFSAKDFRTWSGTLLMIHALGATAGATAEARSERPSERQIKREIKRALERVAAELGNTVAVCRKSYVHPGVIDQFSSGELFAALERARSAARERPIRGLRGPEAVTVRWLEAI